MSEQQKILIIDDNKDNHQLLGDILEQYQIDNSYHWDEANERIDKTHYDLILLTLNLDQQNTTHLVEKLHQSDTCKSAPIVYLVNSDCPEEIISGSNYCDINSIQKPFGKELFNQQIKQLLSESDRYEKLSSELTVVTDTMLTMVNENSRVYDICRFLQRSFFCKDVHSLCEQLFIVTRGFGLKASLYIHTDRNHFFISDQEESGQNIHNDILEMVKDEARIFRFGNDRCVFNWEPASLLVDKLRGDVDILAMLMDGFENGIKAIESVDEFNEVLDKYRQQNHELNVSIARVVDDVAVSINKELSSFGTSTELTIEQEEALLKIAEEHREQVDQLFHEGVNLDEELSTIITRMRTNGSEVKQEDDSIEFL